MGVTNTPAPSARAIISRATKEDFDLLRDLLNAIRELPSSPRNFPVTSLQVNTGATTIHTDKPNVGMSCTFTIGSFFWWRTLVRW